MVVNRAAVEEFEEKKVQIPFAFKGIAVPAGATVTLEYQTFESGKWGPAGWTSENLAVDPGGSFTGSVEMDEGAKFRYRYRVSDGTNMIFFPKGSPGFIEKIAREGPESSPSASVPVAEVRTRLKQRVQDVLAASRDETTAGSLNALMDLFENEVDTMGLAGDNTALILSLISETISSMEGVPRQIKHFFRKEAGPPKDYNNLSERLRKGSTGYRRAVFAKLLANKDSREHFELTPGDTFNPVDPLGNAKFNKEFDRLCAKHGDLSSIAPYIGLALERASNVPARNPAALIKLRAQMKQVAARLQAEGKGDSILKQMPAHRKGRFADIAFQSAVVAGGLATGTILIPAAILAGKAALRSILGVSEGDIIHALESPEGSKARKEFLAIMGRNNIVSQAIATKGSSGEVIKNRFWDAVKRSIPGSALRMKSERPKSFREDSSAPEDEAEEAGATSNTEELISKACREASA